MTRATLTSQGICPSCYEDLPHPGNCSPEWHAGHPRPRLMYLPGVSFAPRPTCRGCGDECRLGRAYCGACAPRMVEREAVAA